MPREDRFTGRTAVVTGGSGGLGWAVAAGLAAEGASVAVVDVAADAVRAVAADLRETGVPAQGLVCDVADGEAVTRLMADVHAALGGPHVLVTCAGGSLGTPRDLAETRPDDVATVLDVNLAGTFFCCQAAAPYMAEAATHGGPRGAIVTVSSIGGRSASPVTGVPYAAAKAGVLGLTRRLAREVGPAGTRVNAVAPGFFATGPRLQGLWDAMSPEEQGEVLQAIPLRRMPEVAEAVDPVLFLASDEASYVTGAVLDVNGGRFMAG
jgi:NAD(P)-dependent dehydrogenase (short-subunit alcohol dehydrogenase family)